MRLTKAVLDFLGNPYVGILATVGETGRPQATPIWFLVEEDGTVLVNTSRGRAKLRNVQSNPHVALVVVDPANPYRYVQIRGKVRDIDSASGARDFDRLSVRYTGQPFEYGPHYPPERRVSLRIEPFQVQAAGL